MAGTDETLQRYINKMLQMQNEQREKPLTAEELKEIALDIGMSEEEWLASQQAAQDYLSSGQTLLSYGSWEEAAKQFEQARNIMPYSQEANYGLAKALTEYWKDSNSVEDLEKARVAIRASLSLSPTHAPTLALLPEIEQEQKADKQKKRQLFLTTASIVAGLLVILAASYFGLSNAVVSQQEDTKSAWAQVENVFDRRASLIPQMLSIAKSQLNAQKTLVEKLENAQQSLQGQKNKSSLSEEEIANFKKAQDQLSQAINQLMEKAASRGEGKIGEALYDLKVDISGSENRIRVEIKRYNEQVSKYNRLVETFPYSLLGFAPMAYYKGNADKSSPDIKLD